MGLFDRIIKCDNDGIGDKLDALLNCNNNCLIAYYKNKYGYGFHTSVALLRTGLMPGHDRQIMRAISEEIASVRGKEHGKGISFIHKVVSNRIKDFYGIDFSEIKYKRGPKKKDGPLLLHRYASRDSGDGVCMDCGQRFVIDAKNHPTNLCICIKCAPRGIHYSEAVTGNFPITSGSYRNHKKGSKI